MIFMLWRILREDARLHLNTRIYIQWFLGGLMSYLRYLCLFAIVVASTYCIVCLLWFSSSCVPYVASFSGFSIVYCPSVFSNVYLSLQLNPVYAIYALQRWKFNFTILVSHGYYSPRALFYALFTVKCVIVHSSNRMYRCTTESKMNCKNKDPNKG